MLKIHSLLIFWKHQPRPLGIMSKQCPENEVEMGASIWNRNQENENEK